jgi:hypothetical protein
MKLLTFVIVTVYACNCMARQDISNGYVCCLSAVPSEREAIAAVDRYRAQSVAANHLWIPDYAGLSGKPLFLVYSGPYTDVATARVKLEQLKSQFNNRSFYIKNVGERIRESVASGASVHANNKSVTVVTSPPTTEERCYTSTNSRGQQFRLHISLGGDGNPTSVRYRDKSTSIPLSYYGREMIHVPEFNTSTYAKTYTETHNGRTTGKVYFLERRLSNGVGVVFERTSDGQFFYYADCSSSSQSEQRANSNNASEAQEDVRVINSNPAPVPAAAKTTETPPPAEGKSTNSKTFRKSMILKVDKGTGAAGRKP